MFLSGKDVFVAMSTGFSESLCFALIPVVFVRHDLQSTAGCCARHPKQTEREGAPELFNRRSVRTRHTTDVPAPLLSVLFSFRATSFPHALQLANVARGFDCSHYGGF